MKELFSYFKRVDHIWQGIWLFIFCGFISLDAFFPNFFGVTMLKLLGIAFCFIYVIYKFPHDKLIVLAFLLTFIADLVLAFNNTSRIGVLIFTLAQFAHFARIKPLGKREAPIAIAALVAYIILAFAAGPYSIYLLGTIYAFFLVSNLILAYKWHKKSPKSGAGLSAFYGFIFFMCCDLCVAGSFFSTIHILPLFIKRLFDFFAWAFYYPSQVLISNSSKKKPKTVERML
ncbi:hypothetical protein IKW75_02830 [Candidatus Saccharibacteria bacterium]|nr:hypothetical protein [Candidatus Saccharibacteria bacterium]